MMQYHPPLTLNLIFHVLRPFSADSKMHGVKNGNAKPRSILLPVSAHEQQQFRTIKIVNSSHAKSANIKAAAANLLQKSKQGLLNKNIFMPKEEYIGE